MRNYYGRGLCYLIIYHILREPNSIIVLLICICEPFLEEVICILNFGISSISHLYFAFGISSINFNIQTNYVIMSYMCFQYSMMMS